MEPETLNDPTVGEMTAFLQKFPPDTPFLIRDPDTGWTIHIIHAEKDQDGVWLTGEYHEMKS